MAKRQDEFKKGDVFFLAKGRIIAQKDCVRGEPPDGTTKWAVNGESERGWMEIETFSGQVKRKSTKGAV
jgi:hypothetical protein